MSTVGASVAPGVDGTTIQYSNGRLAVNSAGLLLSYSGTNPANPSSGTVLSQGFAPVVGAAANGAWGLGVAGLSGTEASERCFFGLAGANPTGITSLAAAPLVRGCTYKVKGFMKARTATSIDAAFERFAFGVVQSGQALANTQVAATAETTRDQVTTVAVVVDSSNAVKRYNCTAGGNANYSDPVPGATTKDPATGFSFELIVAVPAAGDSAEDVTVSLYLDGTLMYSAAPVDTNTDRWCPFLMINCDGEATQIVYQVIET